jgi:hypothetical protein
VQKFSPGVDTDFQQNNDILGTNGVGNIARLASPDSITEQEDIDDEIQKQPHCRTRLSTHRNQVHQMEMNSLRHHSSLRNLAASNPLTPVTNEKDRKRASRHIAGLRITSSYNYAEQALPSPTNAQQRTRLMASHSRTPSHLQHNHDLMSSESSDIHRGADRDFTSDSRTERECVVPTPPADPRDQQLSSRPPSRRNAPSVPSRLSFVDSSNGQDGSLPSPSLSPITAAAAMQNGLSARARHL